MRGILFAFLLGALAAPSGAVNNIAAIARESRLPLPAGWAILGPTGEFPVAVAHEATGVRLLIFCRTLAPDERIEGADDFRMAVNRVIDSVVLQLPDALLLTSTGSLNHNRADFNVEFQTLDTLSGAPVRYRLGGVLYRHPDGHQLLFSFWAQGPQDVFDAIRGDLETMQAGFSYTGPQEENVFSSARFRIRWLAAGAVALTAALFVLRRRRRPIKPPVS